MNRKKQKLSLRKNEVETQSEIEEMLVLRQKIMSMEAELQLKNEEKDYLVKRVTSLEQELVKKETQLKLKDEEQEHLLERVTSLEQELAEKETQINLKNEEQEHLEKRVASLEKDLKETKTQVQLIKEPFDALPNEVVLEIFKHLTQNELGKIAGVCRRWDDLTRCPILWKKVNVKVHWSHVSQNDVFKHFISRVPCSSISLKVDFMEVTNWIQPLNFYELCLIMQEKCPNLKQLILYDSKLSNTRPSIVYLCSQFLPNVKSLILRYPEFLDRPATVQHTETSKITVLDVTGLWGIKHFSKSLLSRMPCLKKLYLSHTDINDSWFKKGISFLNRLEVLNLRGTNVDHRAFQALKNHGQNLKELYMCWTELDDEDLNCDIPTLPHLKTICLNFCFYVTCEGVVSLVQYCPSLQNIYVDRDLASSYMEHPFVIANPCKLGIVQFIDCDKHDKIYHECEYY